MGNGLPSDARPGESASSVPDQFGIRTARRENRERFARFAYKAPVITTAERQTILARPDVQARIERRKRQIVDALVEEEARKAAKTEFEENTGLPPVQYLMELAAAVTGISVEILRSGAKARRFAWPRHFAMWLVHTRRWDLSTPQIGKVFGGRDHTTLLHAFQNVEKHRTDLPFAEWFADRRVQVILSAGK